MTAEELFNKWDNLSKELEQNFYPLLIATSSALTITHERIFTEGKNIDGDVMLNKKPYSTKPTYIDRDKSPRQVPFGTGKTGREIKSYYFPSGYSQFKGAIGRGILELSLQLRNDWVTANVVLDKSNLSVALKQDINADKAEGLQKDSQYGRFLGFDQSELDALTKVIEFELAKAFNE